MMKKNLLLLAVIFISSFTFATAQNKAKPELNSVDLKKHTHHFDIKDGKLVGDGAKFIVNEAVANQYFLLGEYHNSYRISEFTKALIPILHENKYRYFGLEVGPISQQILSELSKDSSKTIQNLHKFNSKYYEPTSRRNLVPIPFFGNVSDAEFLTEATKRKWNLIGVDQEFSFSYLPLLNRMFANLSQKRKQQLQPSHKQAVNAVREAYKIRLQTGKNHYQKINNSSEYNNFLKLASDNNSRNKVIADALRKTTGIYLDNVNRNYFKANSDRIDYIKKNLSLGFKQNKFDLKKDKMLLKMGGVHTAKGFANLSLFDIGNTLHELARFNGNKSLHAAFYSRYYVDKGKEIDALADKTSFSYRFKDLLQMGKKDQWTIIDLRPMRSDVFYSRKYKLDDVVLNIFKLHDIVIIPKIDTETTRNYDLRVKN